jgi:hypothetical protein
MRHVVGVRRRSSPLTLRWIPLIHQNNLERPKRAQRVTPRYAA